MECSKKLYGKAVIDNSDSVDFNENYKIELDYYKTSNKTSNKPYGIEIVKRTIERDKIDTENKIINNICNKEQETNKLLDILMSNKVTPISVEDIIHDLTIKEVI